MWGILRARPLNSLAPSLVLSWTSCAYFRAWLRCLCRGRRSLASASPSRSICLTFSRRTWLSSARSARESSFYPVWRECHWPWIRYAARRTDDSFSTCRWGALSLPRQSFRPIMSSLCWVGAFSLVSAAARKCSGCTTSSLVRKLVTITFWFTNLFIFILVLLFYSTNIVFY